MEDLIIESHKNFKLECHPQDYDNDMPIAIVIAKKHEGNFRTGKKEKNVRTHFFLKKEQAKELGEYLLKISK